MLLKIVIIVILIVINILAFIYMYKNDSDEINYDKWCKMLQDETKDNIELIRKNEKRINARIIKYKTIQTITYFINGKQYCRYSLSFTTNRN